MLGTLFLVLLIVDPGQLFVHHLVKRPLFLCWLKGTPIVLINSWYRQTFLKRVALQVFAATAEFCSMKCRKKASCPQKQNQTTRSSQKIECLSLEETKTSVSPSWSFSLCNVHAKDVLSLLKETIENFSNEGKKPDPSSKTCEVCVFATP